MAGFCVHLNIGRGPGTFIGMLPEEHLSVGIDIAPRQIECENSHYGAENRTFRSVAPGDVPFAAILGWRLADRIARLEPANLVDRFGLLLFASAVPAP